ncbi:MAG: hypothetical protein CSA74_09315 [Rhodobacterales bacterium]|nr:MAG: hypothetical protein CSA74_09315 [Rhodobacterales bacterium]
MNGRFPKVVDAAPIGPSLGPASRRVPGFSRIRHAFAQTFARAVARRAETAKVLSEVLHG